MKYIISGGGTGGHIYPALAILEEIQNRDKNADILYVGNSGSMEERIISEKGIPFQPIKVSGMPRKVNKEFFKRGFQALGAFFDSRKIVKNFDPDIVIGTGGFVTGPIVLAGAMKKKKTLIHEQNSLPGVTNRILSRYVDRICTTYKASIPYFKKKDIAVVTGNPIRAAFYNLEKTDQTYEKYGLNKDLKTVMVFGGSNGSEKINAAVQDLINNCEDLDFQIIIGTGRDNYDKFLKGLRNKDLMDKLSIHPYLDDIMSAYSISDLIITSSGAISLAEISALGLASILIPKSYTAENHQEFNAKLYRDQGASDMILEAELDWYTLYKKIENILENEDLLKLMGENAKKFANPTATYDIVDEVYKLVDGGDDGKE